MVVTSGNPNVVRFGPYELHLQAHELRKRGVPIKLQDQPFQILAMLLERPGEVVSREELQKRLWPADTFVDFDLSLNSAVKKLRQALNDDAEDPRYIETLYRRGYRFIGPLNDLAAQAEIGGNEIGSDGGDSKVPTLAEAAPTLMPTDSEHATAPLRFHHARKLFWLGGLAILLAASLTSLFFLTRQRPIRILGYTQITHDGRLKVNMVTDGDPLYMSEEDNEHFVIAQVSARGGETSILPTPFPNVFIGDIAPDGSSLLVADFKSSSSVSGLWRLLLPSVTPQRVGNILPSAVAFSPDGKQLAYAADNSIYLANPDGTGSQKLTSLNGMVNNLAFSPDGARIRFDLHNTNAESSSLWEVQRNGADPKPLLPASDASLLDCCGKWTRDGRYFVFHRFRNGTNNLWVLPERRWWQFARRVPVQLTNGPLAFSFPLPSPDGKKIYAVGTEPRAEFVRFGGERVGFVPYLVNTSATDLAFSPDGQWIAYVSIPDHKLWRSRLDGSQPLQLTPSSLFAGLPRWSPDGKQIVFMARTYTSNYRAYLISTNGGEVEPLVPGAEAGFDPNWSPDGKTIVAALTDPESSASAGISIVDVASRTVSSVPGSTGYFSPRYSPDGKYIVAISNDSLKLMLFDRSTSRWSELIGEDIGLKGYPTFSHDGQYLYFDTAFTVDSAFYRLRLADHKLERLFSLRDLRRFHGDLGSWTGLTPDDSPLLVRDMSSQEVYAIDWEAP
jgi:Tol biopolymer transport system component/DNA-binding winged helix-turn-helix (wHTH) protein